MLAVFLNPSLNFSESYVLTGKKKELNYKAFLGGLHDIMHVPPVAEVLTLVKCMMKDEKIVALSLSLSLFAIAIFRILHGERTVCVTESAFVHSLHHLVL